MSNNSKILKKKVLSEKKPFTKKIKNKKEIDEFFDLDVTNVNPRYNSQIFTNTPKSYGDNEYFTKGLSTITDKLALYANPRNWWQLYLRGYPIIRTLNENEGLKDIIKELLSKRDDIDELVSKDSPSNVEKILKLIDGLNDDEIKEFKDKLNKLNK